jgi:hypothetical protein
VIITNQAINLLTSNKASVYVLCEDTDVFVLLCHYYQSLDVSGTLIMRTFSDSDPFTNIGCTVQKQPGTIQHLISLHALTHCDSVPAYSRLGKATAINVLKQGIEPPALGFGTPDMDKATMFIGRCYGATEGESSKTMSEIRVNIWRKKNRTSRSIILEHLPPTTECFEPNVHRAELQAAVWRSSMMSKPPDLDVTKHGWIKDEETQSLSPVYSSSPKPFIPKKLECLLSCSCSGDEPCKRMQCGCHKNQLPCSMFCNCYSTQCHSPCTPICSSASNDIDTPAPSQDLDPESDNNEENDVAETDSD